MNALGLAILKSFESCQLKAYPDPGSPLAKACAAKGIPIYEHGYEALPNWDRLQGHPWTNGWGDTRGVEPGDVISRVEADRILLLRIAEQEALVRGCLRRQVDDNQFSALTDFAYNEGITRLRGSTLLAEVNVGNMAVSSEFEKWDLAGGVPMKGLLERRKAEAALFRGDEMTVREILASRGYRGLNELH